MIQAFGLLPTGRRKCIRLSGGRAPACWRRQVARSTARLATLARASAWLEAVTEPLFELRSGPLLGTCLAAVALDAFGSTTAEVAPDSEPTRHSWVPLSGGLARAQEGVAEPGGEPSRRGSPGPSAADPRDVPGRHPLALLLDLRRQASLELLVRLAGSQRSLTGRSVHDGNLSTPSFAPGSSRRTHKPVKRPGGALTDPLAPREAIPEDRDLGRKQRRSMPAIPSDTQGSPAHHTWAAQAVRRATKAFHHALWRNALGTLPETGLEGKALAREWSAHFAGPTAPPELLAAWAKISHRGDSAGGGHRSRRATIPNPLRESSLLERKAGAPASSGNPSPSPRSRPSATGPRPADAENRQAASDRSRDPLEAHPERAFCETSVSETKALRLHKSPKEWFPDGPLAYEVASEAHHDPWVTLPGAGGTPPAGPGPPAAPMIAPPVVIEALPALLPAKSPRKPAPPVASLLAVHGARAEAALTGNDLSALAEKIKRILDDQARRHGISV